MIAGNVDYAYDFGVSHQKVTDGYASHLDESGYVDSHSNWRHTKNSETFPELAKKRWTDLQQVFNLFCKKSIGFSTSFEKMMKELSELEI